MNTNLSLRGLVRACQWSRVCACKAMAAYYYCSLYLYYYCFLYIGYQGCVPAKPWRHIIIVLYTYIIIVLYTSDTKGVCLQSHGGIRCVVGVCV